MNGLQSLNQNNTTTSLLSPPKPNAIPATAHLAETQVESIKSWWQTVYFKYALLVVVMMTLLTVAIKYFIQETSLNPHMIKKLKAIIEQATRWNAMAQQDTNPILQLIHCNYALCYALLARDLASDRDIAKLTGVDIHELIDYLKTCESYAIKNMGQQCPRVKVDGIYSVGSSTWNAA